MVTQADREAGAMCAVLEEMRERIRAGQCDDHEMVQTFVRHRIAGVKAGIDAAAKAFRSAQYDPAPYTRGMAALQKIDPEMVP